MPDYYRLISRTVAGLETNTAETRHELYEHARRTLLDQLRNMNPPWTNEEITRERLGLEEAIHRVEADANVEFAIQSSEPLADLLRLLNENDPSSADREELKPLQPEGRRGSEEEGIQSEHLGQAEEEGTAERQTDEKTP
jgi:hypothetical protein